MDIDATSGRRSSLFRLPDVDLSRPEYRRLRESLSDYRSHLPSPVRPVGTRNPSGPLTVRRPASIVMAATHKMRYRKIQFPFRPDPKQEMSRPGPLTAARRCHVENGHPFHPKTQATATVTAAANSPEPSRASRMRERPSRMRDGRPHPGDAGAPHRDTSPNKREHVARRRGKHGHSRPAIRRAAPG